LTAFAQILNTASAAKAVLVFAGYRTTEAVP